MEEQRDKMIESTTPITREDMQLYHYRKMLRTKLSLFPLVALLSFAMPTRAQQHFSRQIPAGNYSGICQVDDGLFAVVDDKNEEDGFYLFRLTIDNEGRRITKAENVGYRSSGLPNRDMEGICYRPSTRTLFINGEKDNEVFEYELDGKRTGKKLNIPAQFKRARSNQGIEALTYDTLYNQFYITTECPLPGDTLLRIQAFGDNLQPSQQYLYKPDKPISNKYTHGVSALCALGDGRLLVLERQIYVPPRKINAQTVISIYEVKPVQEEKLLTKRLVSQFNTRLTLTSRKFANYEGMCALSPHRLLLVADSQNQYTKVLRDWFLLLGL